MKAILANKDRRLDNGSAPVIKGNKASYISTQNIQIDRSGKKQ